jgi:hypothetical protein
MANDFDEFFKRLGREVPTYRTCPECDDTVVVNPETYDKPKTVCDPGYCEQAVPYCICRDAILYTERQVENECTYPDCARTPPKKEASSDL